MERRILADYVFVVMWSYIIGVALFSFFNVSAVFLSLILISALSLFTIEFLHKRNVQKLSLLTLIACVLLGMLVSGFNINKDPQQAEDFLADSRNENIEGVIHASPIKKEGFYNLKTESGQKILLDAPFTSLHEGDYVTFENNVELIDTNYFYRNTLLAHKIYLHSKNPEITVLASKERENFFNILRNKLDGNIERAISYPESRVLSAMILGITDLPSELQNSLSNAGIIHIISISGMHVAVIAAAIFYICATYTHFSPQYGVLCTLSLVALYIIFIGFPAAAIRSGLMIALYFFARATGRKSHIGRITILALFIMLIFNPHLLVYDIGFQLSFLALLGIIYISPQIKELFTKKTDGKVTDVVKETIAISLGAQIATTPVILLNFGNLALLSPLFNIVTVPFLPFILALGTLGMLIGNISTFSSVIIQFPVYIVLKVIDILSELAPVLKFPSYKEPWFISIVILLQVSIFSLLLYRTEILEKETLREKMQRIVL